jgi:ABC-type Mn2+/Zn2+ transport system permease subunit
METLQRLFLDPLAFAFMQRALIGTVLVGVTCGVVGAYVVTRGLSFLGDALAHSILPGVALVYISGSTSQGAVLFGGLVAGVVSALGIGFLTRGRRLQEDTAIGIIFAGMLALGIAIISSSRSFATDLQHIIIGNILAIGITDLLLIAGIGGVVLLLVVLFYKELLVSAFDPVLAETLRLPNEALRVGMIVLLAITIVISTQGAGVLMATAMLIIPSSVARLLTHRLHWMMVLGAFIGAGCGVVGLYVAWHLNVAASASIVLTMTALFIAVFLFAPQRGYVWSLLGWSAHKA